MASTERSSLTGSFDEYPIPQALGRYQLREQIAAGSQAAVFIGYDGQLHRIVAIKIIHPHLLNSPEARRLFETEARILAKLDHPHIVPVYDVGRSDDGLPYLVSKFIAGASLNNRLEEGRPTHAKAAEWIALMADAAHSAHQQGLVHRDIKPGNILLDQHEQPYLADFGIALSADAYGTGPTCVGTPKYMSPEQARGESHRVNARTDVYALGLVLYELLCGRCPFEADNRNELFEKIINESPPALQAIDPTISTGLQRICLKALEKRSADRYATALDLADDLRHWSRDRADKKGTARAGGIRTASEPGQTGALMIAPTVVPRGVRPFQTRDADFFLTLLPGARNRDGLPESVAFWKHRLETTNPNHWFSVGILYGPSGCGKSSLMRAGVLPNLAERVRYLFVEARAQDTELVMRNLLRQSFPHLPVEGTLVDLLAAVRRGEVLEEGDKLVLVIDQFEQWLHSSRTGSRDELVSALRQCDAARLQCVLLVRDDFWLPLTRFLRELEVPLVDGKNFILVDLFSPTHAMAVLAELGRGHGCLPPRPAALTTEQQQFVAQAVRDLTEEEQVVPMRLSLLAEVVKNRVWHPTTLDAVGGARGIGLIFLEQMFEARTAPAPQRHHANGARAVLRALLPMPGVAIRGAGVDRQSLLSATEYSDRKEFDELMHLLDVQLRLLTPIPDAGSTPSETTERYQLSHDFLVQPIRSWLEQKQHESMRGRAELRLAQRTAAWEARPESQALPLAWEWLSIVLFTKWKSWTSAQRTMMRQATRRHLTRGLVFLIVAGFSIWGSVEIGHRMQERARRNRLLQPTLSPEAREFLRDLDFSDLVARIPGNFYVKDRNGVYIYSNDYWVWSAEEGKPVLYRGVDLIGKTDMDMPWKADAPMYLEQDRQVIESGKPALFESDSIGRFGKPIRVKTLKSPLRDRQGKIIGVIGCSMPQDEADPATDP